MDYNLYIALPEEDLREIGISERMAEWGGEEIIERRIKYTCGQDIFSFIRQALDWESPQNMEIFRSLKAEAARILQKMKDKNIQRNDALSVADVADFEKNAGIRLPEELTLFYTEACNGCKMLDGFDLLKMEQWKYDADSLKRDFPFEKYWVWENDDDYNPGKIKETENGNLALIDIGDAQSWNIIVRGKERGRMWFFTDVGIQPCAPAMDFLEWFEYWLDGKDDFFYGFQPEE